MSEFETNPQDDFEAKPKKTKEFWLFLIFADIIALAFFGFLIYQTLSVKFSAPAPDKPAVIKDAPAPQQQPAPQPVQQQPAQQAPAKPAAPAPAPQPALTTPAQVPAEPVIQSITPKPDPAEPKLEDKAQRQSVVVEPTKSSKTRKVTFKYFEEADKVQISSGFTMAKPQNLKKINGVWEGSFIIYPGEYKYIFIVDGKQKLDPHAQEKDGRSFIVVK